MNQDITIKIDGIEVAFTRLNPVEDRMFSRQNSRFIYDNMWDAKIFGATVGRDAEIYNASSEAEAAKSDWEKYGV